MLPNNFGGKLDKTSLMCLAILWCHGSTFEKANVFFDLLTPSYKQRQDVVMSSDDEWEVVFDSLIEIATITIIQHKHLNCPDLLTDDFDPVMRRRAIQAMRLSSLDEPKTKSGFIYLMYGF